MIDGQDVVVQAIPVVELAKGACQPLNALGTTHRLLLTSIAQSVHHHTQGHENDRHHPVLGKRRDERTKDHDQTNQSSQLP
jgi:hypothetical protein